MIKLLTSESDIKDFELAARSFDRAFGSFDHDGTYQPNPLNPYDFMLYLTSNKNEVLKLYDYARIKEPTLEVITAETLNLEIEMFKVGYGFFKKCWACNLYCDYFVKDPQINSIKSGKADYLGSISSKTQAHLWLKVHGFINRNVKLFNEIELAVKLQGLECNTTRPF